MPSDDTLLRVSLEVAVPVWVRKLQGLPWSLVAERMLVCAEAVAYNGDAILYRVPGKSAEAFNRLAEAVAALSFAPGGVAFCGRRWDHTHPEAP